MKTRFQWIAGSGIVVGIIVLLMGAGTIEDSGIFQSLKLGGKTNLISDDGSALTYNGTHYQISSATLTNASTNTFTGAGLIVLQTSVPANQTNTTLVSLGGMAASAALTNLNQGIGTGLTNLLAAAVTNALSATLSGLALIQGSVTGTGATVLSNSPTINQPVLNGRVTWTSSSSNVLASPTLTTAQKNALSGVQAGDHVYDSDLGRYQVYDGAAWHSRVRLDGDTMTGVLTVPALDYGTAIVLTPIDDGTAVNLASTTRTFTCVNTGSVTYVISNPIEGKRFQLRGYNSQATNIVAQWTGGFGFTNMVVPATSHYKFDGEVWLINGATNVDIYGVVLP